MTIYTSNFIVTGTISNFPALYTNNMTAPELSNIVVKSPLEIQGDIYTNGRMDVGKTIFATFRLNSNIPLNGSNEYVAKSNEMTMDFTTTDMSGMSNVPMTVPPYMVYNQSTGIITVPTSGFYNLSMQGSFSNSIPDAVNGVYYRFINQSYSNARVAANTSYGPIVSTSAFRFLLGGDRLIPTFYSSDSNATMLGGTGETYVNFYVMATVTPTHSNYFRQ